MKGILFKPDMIQATVEGRKTNTRRVEASLREINKEPDRWHLTNRKSVWALGCFIFEDGQTEVAIKPRYQVGETVYIKEAWAIIKENDGVDISDMSQNSGVFYKSDYPEPYGDPNDPEAGMPLNIGRWRSPLFVPEWAARYFIVIEQVRAERLQVITYEDCLKEGVEETREFMQAPRAFGNFIRLWDSINPKYPWESNPWVFPYTFSLKEGK